MKKALLFVFAISLIAVSCSKDPAIPRAIPAFEASENELFVNQEFNLENTSEYSSFFRWDFGDGNVSDEKEPTHKYSQAGDYIITLTVNKGDTTTRTVKVHDADRAVYFENKTSHDLEITLFDRISLSQIGEIRYELGKIKSGERSKSIFTNESALGLAGKNADGLQFMITEPFVFELKEGKVNALEMNDETKLKMGVGLPEWKD